MKKLHSVRSFVAGVLVTLLVVALVPAAVAATASRNITIYPGISVYVDEKKLDPKDANGKTVEVFTSNGTTYLPVRAISEALGEPVDWDGATRTVYIGRHITGTTLASYLSDTDYFYSSGSAPTVYASVKDNVGSAHTHCFASKFDRTYLLNGNYSHITGTLFLPYSNRNSTTTGTSGVSIYGDGELLFTCFPEKGVQGFRPIDFNVPLDGVTELRVVYAGSTLYLGDTALWK